MDEGCTNPTQCANCSAPFKAGHLNCPAAPKKHNGRLVKPTKAALRTIRNIGQQSFLQAQQIEAEQQAANEQIATELQGAQDTAQQEEGAQNTTQQEEEDQNTAQQAQGTRKRGLSTSRTTVPGPLPTVSININSSAPRPRRSAAPTQSLNVRQLSQQNSRFNENDIEMSSSL